jgi:hypothetical protein
MPPDPDPASTAKDPQQQQQQQQRQKSSSPMDTTTTPPPESPDDATAMTDRPTCALLPSPTPVVLSQARGTALAASAAGAVTSDAQGSVPPVPSSSPRLRRSSSSSEQPSSQRRSDTAGSSGSDRAQDSGSASSSCEVSPAPSVTANQSVISSQAFSLLTRARMPSVQHRMHCFPLPQLLQLLERCAQEAEEQRHMASIQGSLALSLLQSGRASDMDITGSEDVQPLPTLPTKLLEAAPCQAFRTAFSGSVHTVQSFFFQMRGELTHRMMMVEKQIKLHILKQQQDAQAAAKQQANGASVQLSESTSQPMQVSDGAQTNVSKPFGGRDLAQQQESQQVSRLRGGAASASFATTTHASTSGSSSGNSPHFGARGSSVDSAGSSVMTLALASPDHPLWTDVLRLCHDLQTCAQFVILNYLCLWHLLAGSRDGRVLSAESVAIYERQLTNLDDPLNIGELLVDTIEEMQALAQLAMMALDAATKTATRTTPTQSISPTQTGSSDPSSSSSGDHASPSHHHQIRPSAMPLLSSPRMNSSMMPPPTLPLAHSMSGRAQRRNTRGALLAKQQGEASQQQRGNSDGTSSSLTSHSFRAAMSQSSMLVVPELERIAASQAFRVGMSQTNSLVVPEMERVITSSNTGPAQLPSLKRARQPSDSSEEHNPGSGSGSGSNPIITPTHQKAAGAASICTICESHSTCTIALSGCSHLHCLTCLLTHPSFGIQCPSCQSRPVILGRTKLSLEGMLFESGISMWEEVKRPQTTELLPPVPEKQKSINSVESELPNSSPTPSTSVPMSISPSPAPSTVNSLPLSSLSNSLRSAGALSTVPFLLSSVSPPASNFALSDGASERDGPGSGTGGTSRSSSASAEQGGQSSGGSGSGGNISGNDRSVSPESFSPSTHAVVTLLQTLSLHSVESSRHRRLLSRVVLDDAPFSERRRRRVTSDETSPTQMQQHQSMLLLGQRRRGDKGDADAGEEEGDSPRKQPLYKRMRLHSPHSASSEPSSPRQQGMSETAAELYERSAVTGASCHQCKVSQPPSQLMFCSNQSPSSAKPPGPKSTRADSASPARKERQKKFCFSCMRRLYHEQTITQRSDWTCPSCLGTCICAGCCRKGGRKTATELSMNGSESTKKERRKPTPSQQVKKESQSQIQSVAPAQVQPVSQSQSQQEDETMTPAGRTFMTGPSSQHPSSAAIGMQQQPPVRHMQMSYPLMDSNGGPPLALPIAQSQNPAVLQEPPMATAGFASAAETQLLPLAQSYSPLQQPQPQHRPIFAQPPQQPQQQMYSHPFQPQTHSVSPPATARHHQHIQHARAANARTAASQHQQSVASSIREADLHPHVLARGMVGVAPGSGSSPAISSTSMLTGAPLRSSATRHAHVYAMTNDRPMGFGGTAAPLSHGTSGASSDGVLRQRRLPPPPVRVSHVNHGGSSHRDRDRSECSRTNSSSHGSQSSESAHSIRSMVEADDRRVQRELEREQAKTRGFLAGMTDDQILAALAAHPARPPAGAVRQEALLRARTDSDPNIEASIALQPALPLPNGEDGPSTFQRNPTDVEDPISESTYRQHRSYEYQDHFSPSTDPELLRMRAEAGARAAERAADRARQSQRPREPATGATPSATGGQDNQPMSHHTVAATAESQQAQAERAAREGVQANVAAFQRQIALERQLHQSSQTHAPEQRMHDQSTSEAVNWAAVQQILSSSQQPPQQQHQQQHQQQQQQQVPSLHDAPSLRYHVPPSHHLLSDGETSGFGVNHRSGITPMVRHASEHQVHSPPAGFDELNNRAWPTEPEGVRVAPHALAEGDRVSSGDEAMSSSNGISKGDSPDPISPPAPASDPGQLKAPSPPVLPHLMSRQPITTLMVATAPTMLDGTTPSMACFDPYGSPSRVAVSPREEMKMGSPSNHFDVSPVQQPALYTQLSPMVQSSPSPHMNLRFMDTTIGVTPSSLSKRRPSYSLQVAGLQQQDVEMTTQTTPLGCVTPSVQSSSASLHSYSFPAAFSSSFNSTFSSAAQGGNAQQQQQQQPRRPNPPTPLHL